MVAANWSNQFIRLNNVRIAVLIKEAVSAYVYRKIERNQAVEYQHNVRFSTETNCSIYIIIIRTNYVCINDETMIDFRRIHWNALFLVPVSSCHLWGGF